MLGGRVHIVTSTYREEIRHAKFLDEFVD